MTTIADTPADFLTGPSILDDAKAGGDRALVQRMLCTELATQIRMECVDSALAIVTDEDLHGGARTIVEAIRSLREERAHVDLATVVERLAERRQIRTAFGTIDGVLGYLCAEPRAWNADAVARVVAEWGRRDRMQAAGARAAEAAAAGDTEGVARAYADVERHAAAGVDYGIDRVVDIADRVLSSEESAGMKVGWRSLDAVYRVEPGLLTVVTGWPGASKSTVVDNAMVMLARAHEWRFAVFSPESAPTERHVRRLACMHAERSWDAMDEGSRGWHVGWVDAHFEWIRSTDAVDLPSILRFADAIHRRRPINGLTIDPWNEVEHTRPRDVTETQHISASLTALRRWGRRRDVHCWVIAHPVKPPERGAGVKPPHLSMIAGSQTWRDKADMGLVVHRDQAKGGPTEVQVHKVRFQAHGQVGGKALLRYLPHCGGYVDERARPL